MTTNNVTGYSDQCALCFWFIGFTGVATICYAFPDGIPDKIITGIFDHRDEHPGDGGIRWREDPVDPEVLERLTEEERMR